MWISAYRQWQSSWILKWIGWWHTTTSITYKMLMKPFWWHWNSLHPCILCNEIGESLSHTQVTYSQRWWNAKIEINCNASSDDTATSIWYGALIAHCRKLCSYGSKIKQGYREATQDITWLTSRLEDLATMHDQMELGIRDMLRKRHVIHDQLVAIMKGGVSRRTKESKERWLCEKPEPTKWTCSK